MSHDPPVVARACRVLARPWSWVWLGILVAVMWCADGVPTAGAAPAPADGSAPAAESAPGSGSAAAAPPATASAPDSAAVTAPPPAGKLVQFDGVNELQLREMVDLVVARLVAERGYRTVDADEQGIRLAPPPEHVRSAATLIRAQGEVRHVIQLGSIGFANLPPHAWMLTATWRRGDEPAHDNPDAKLVTDWLNEARQSAQAKSKALRSVDLSQKRLRLSYVSARRCLDMLKMFGFTTIDNPADAKARIDPAKAPIVIASHQTGRHNLPPPPKADGNFQPTETDPINELIVLYDPARPEQFSAIENKVRELIDQPAKQVVIDALVLEVAESGLDQLGVQWTLQQPEGDLVNLRIGRIVPRAIEDTLLMEFTDIGQWFRVRVEALVSTGKAEVLSRPRVLTLDNRMAYINVAEIIPVVRDVRNPRNVYTIRFRDESAGISLTVRPKVSADDREITMQITAVVTARVPNADLVIENDNDVEVARAPTISKRDVRTYTRIANNTPFIIGGLIARDDSTEQAKVPLLGDIPIVGNLFKDQRRQRSKREVIIVITPRLLRDDQQVSPALPRDEDAFDSFDNQLMRDSYRIRGDDLFDLSFLTQHPRLLGAQQIVEQVIDRSPDLADQFPFSEFADGRIPGERTLVVRQMYEVIKRLGLDEKVNIDRAIYFEPGSEQGGFGVDFLMKSWAKRMGVGDLYEPGFFTPISVKMYRKALVLTYTLRPDGDVRDIFSQPVPEVRVVPCPDRATWSRLLWQLNQPDEHGRQRYSIILHDPDDLERLRRAILLKKVVELNAAGYEDLSLSKFKLGRMLLMPSVAWDQVWVIDEHVARYFFLTEQYYPAVIQKLDAAASALQQKLRQQTVLPQQPVGN